MKFKLTFTFLAILGILAAAAWANQEETFLISGKKTVFVEVRAKHMMISKSCEKKPGVFSCEAFSALTKASLKGAFPRPHGGANPGAVVCTTRLDAEVVIGKDHEGNENSFCRFGDGSMVSCGSITYYGRKNDLKRIE